MDNADSSEPPGKRSWFQRVVMDYQQPLARYAKSIVKNWETAKEVVQEVFFKLWREPVVTELMTNSLSLRVWLFKTCRHQCIDLLRKEGRLSPLLDEDQDQLVCPEALPLATLEKREIHLNILEKMKALPERHQEVLRLKFSQELTYQEISDITGHTLNHVGVLIHQAMVNLRTQFAKGESYEA